VVLPEVVVVASDDDELEDGDVEDKIESEATVVSEDVVPVEWGGVFGVVAAVLVVS
jgi:hypothetical protein